MDLAVILPTYNERENIPLVIARLHDALEGLQWEAIFVDDDSPDGTADVVAEIARNTRNVRLLHRVNRRGLASACIEGMMATQARFIAVMDADLQHDEAALPLMIERLRSSSLDVVVATRNAEGGSMGDFSRARCLLSRAGRRISTSICRVEISDPMSGFFMLRRDFLLEVVHGLQGRGFKILVDLLASARRPVRIGEVGYTFRARRFGKSKLDITVGVEYLSMIVNARMGGLLPPELTLYLMVGMLGVGTHLALFLALMHWFHLSFIAMQMTATFVAMTENFYLNNVITFRDQRLRGARLLRGACSFIAICSFGAWANVMFSNDLWRGGAHWYEATLVGILIGSVWNLSISSQFTWRLRRPPVDRLQAAAAYAGALEGTR